MSVFVLYNNKSATCFLIMVFFEDYFSIKRKVIGKAETLKIKAS